jgi:hypothetical protein
MTRIGICENVSCRRTHTNAHLCSKYHCIRVLGFISCVCVCVCVSDESFKTCEVNDELMQNEKTELFVNETLPLRWSTLKEESCVQRHAGTCNFKCVVPLSLQCWHVVTETQKTTDSTVILLSCSPYLCTDRGNCRRRVQSCVRCLHASHTWSKIQQKSHTSWHIDRKKNHLKEVNFKLSQCMPGVVVKALRSKPADRGFDSRLCHWNFSLT